MARLLNKLRTRGSHDRRLDELRRLREQRFERGAKQLDQGRGPRPDHPEPDSALLEGTTGVPELPADQLTAARLRAAILERGCLLVRGLVPVDRARELTGEIDTALAAQASGADEQRSYYDAHDPEDTQLAIARGFVADTGGLWTADSPLIMAEVIELFEAAGLPAIVRDYLGEAPLVSQQKWTLRRVERARVGWHQDGAFLGDVNTINVWLSLSRCGDETPGLDVIPLRLDGKVETGTRDAEFDWDVAQAVAEETAAKVGIERPIFEPGDALLFDEWLLHGTASNVSEGRVRYACETWFFGPSGFPAEYQPIAL
jgi:hypothetical protein